MNCPMNKSGWMKKMLIKIADRHGLGRSRSEIEANLVKEWGHASLTEEQIDKSRFVEKTTGMKWVDKEIIRTIK